MMAGWFPEVTLSFSPTPTTNIKTGRIKASDYIGQHNSIQMGKNKDFLQK